MHTRRARFKNNGSEYHYKLHYNLYLLKMQVLLHKKRGKILLFIGSFF